MVGNLQPDTLYEVKINYNKATKTKIATGVLDIQGREDAVANRNGAQVNKEPLKMSNGTTATPTSANINNAGIGTNGVKAVNATVDVNAGWKTNTHYIRTGPRTNEIYVFAYMDWTGNEQQAGVFYIDNIRIAEYADQPTEKTSDTARVDYQAYTADKFPETIPPIQKFEQVEGSKFVLNTKKQVFSSDEFSMKKTKFLADAMVSKGIIESYTIKTITNPTDGQGIVVVKKPIGFTLPTGAQFDSCAKDAYQIDIDKNKVMIYSDYIEGIQNGTMTILQAFVQRTTLAPGSVKDYTDQVIRGLQVDSGRRYYTIGWIKDQIEIMAYYKQNTLQLRVKDVEGFRYDSQLVPNLVDRKGGYWTKEECQELVKYAAKFNIWC